MLNFAVIENDKVIDTLVADDLITAEAVTNKKCVEFTDENPAYINGTYNGKDFIPEIKYPSWTWDTTTKTWVSPVAYPTDGKQYGWDETTKTWALYVPETIQSIQNLQGIQGIQEIQGVQGIQGLQGLQDTSNTVSLQTTN